LRKFETQSDEAENLSVTESLAARFAAVETEKPLLVVLDDLHSVYDSDWFGEFFNALLSLPTPNVQVLMLARSAPSFPLWRMRSKHTLDVVDEKLLAFTVPETIELFRNYQLSENAARVAHKRAYGRIAKLKEIAEKK
jgi:ATP/maltotriose-dependent transcriptional regulator MalT